MDMNVGSDSASDELEVIADINTTPLIDVMLVLLIITIPIQLHAVNLNLPAGNPQPPLVVPEMLQINIKRYGRSPGSAKLSPIPPRSIPGSNRPPPAP